MAMDPNDAVNIPRGPSGPKTEAGKAKSSRNAIRTGLYAARDFMREGEEEEYAQTLIKLMDELTPKAHSKKFSRPKSWEPHGACVAAVSSKKLSAW